MTPLIFGFALLFAVLLFVACAQPKQRPFPCRPMKQYERYKLKPLELLDWSYMDSWYIREFEARIEECTRSKLLEDQYR